MGPYGAEAALPYSECPAGQGRAEGTGGRQETRTLHSEQRLHCGQAAPSFLGRHYLLKSYWLCSFLKRKTQLHKTTKFPHINLES